MTGGRKDDQGKPRVDLIPPRALLAMGEVLGHGAAKYGADNWKGLENGSRRLYGAALRHLLAWGMGERADPESGLPHLAHALTCLALMMELDGEPRRPGPLEAFGELNEK